MKFSKLLFPVLALSALVLGACDDDGVDTIGPRGGTVTSPDGKVVLQVPAGAFDRDVFVTIGEVDDCPADLDRCYEVEPFGTMLNIPARLTYRYDDENIEPGAAEALAIIGERSQGWSPLPDREVDEDSNTVCGVIASFSSYTISASD